MTWLAILSAVLAFVAALLQFSVSRLKARHDDELRQLRDSGTRLAEQGANYRLKLNALSESSGAGIVMLDERGVVVHANDAVLRVLGIDPNALTGRTIRQATQSLELQEFSAESARSQKTRWSDFRLPIDPTRTLRAWAYPFDVGLSGLPEVMLVLIDVSELRRLETIRRDYVANVSHELRAPLASIRAIAETLHDGAIKDPEFAVKFLDTIVRESDRLSRITSDLLILSDAESKAPVRGWFDLPELLKEVLDRLEPHASERNVDLDLDTTESLPVFASRDQMEQVVVNLVENAIKYTPKGGSVSVRARLAEDHVALSVADTGIGIKESDLARIFERFYRVDKARSRQTGGTGLGLSIVKNIVESHGGEVQVKSAPDKGSTFTILLPDWGGPS